MNSSVRILPSPTTVDSFCIEKRKFVITSSWLSIDSSYNFQLYLMRYEQFLVRQFYLIFDFGIVQALTVYFIFCFEFVSSLSTKNDDGRIEKLQLQMIGPTQHRSHHSAHKTLHRTAPPSAQLTPLPVDSLVLVNCTNGKYIPQSVVKLRPTVFVGHQILDSYETPTFRVHRALDSMLSRRKNKKTMS